MEVSQAINSIIFQKGQNYKEALEVLE